MHAKQWFEVGGVVAFMVVLTCVVIAVRNARHNKRLDWDDVKDVLLLRDEDLGPATMVEGPDSGVGALPPPVPSEAERDDSWADQLAAMNAEHLNLIDHLERVHPAEPCQEWCCWERRLEAQRAAWLELVRADVTVVAEWIVAGTPGRWVPSAAGWPSDDWRGEMIPA